MYSFRSAAESDREILYSIMSKNMSDYFQRFTSEGWSREKFDTGFRPERITICEKDGKVVAFYDVDLIRQNASALYVRNVQVVPGSKPISGVLLQRIEEEARMRGLKLMRGKVFGSNPAIRIFSRLGFQVVEEIESEHSYWMEKTVS